MAQWGAFLAVAAVLTVTVLLLARASQPALSDTAGSDAATGSTVTHNTTAGSGDEPGDEGRQPVDSGEIGHGSRIGPEQSPPIRQDQSDGLPTDDVADHLDGDPIHPGETRDSPAGRSGTATEMSMADLSTGAVLANVAATQGLVAILVVVAAWYFAIPAAAFGTVGVTSAQGPIIVGGIVFGTSLWVGNELATRIADTVGAAYDESVRGMLAPDSLGGWVLLLGVVLPLVAISEEVLFRAALIGVPAAGYGVSPWLLAVVSSIAFALGHGAQGRVGIVVTGLLGFVLAGGYVVTGSLLFVIVAHYVINALEFLVHETSILGD